jgi:branched-chain amino acid transport system permease protein
MTTAVTPSDRLRLIRQRLSAIAWPLGFAMAVPIIFIFYRYVLPNTIPDVQNAFGDWLPLSVVNESLIWVIMALGLNVVVGYAGLLDLGFVAFWALGAYTGAWLMSSFAYQVKIRFLAPPIEHAALGIHISFWLVLIVAAAFCALWGLIIGAPTLRLRSDYLALVTLGFGEIIPQVFTNGDSIFGLNLTNGTRGINPVDPIGTGPLSALPGVPSALGPFDLAYKFVAFAVIVGVYVFISLRIRRGRLGRAWLAIREDELAATMMGVPVVRAKLSAYAVGAVFGGMGGVAYSSLVGGAFPNFSFSNSITILLMVVLGGMGNVWGVMLGAIVLSWINSRGLSQFGNWFNGQFHTHTDFPSYNFLIFGIILVLMMLFRREGLLPESRTRQILREPSRSEVVVDDDPVDHSTNELVSAEAMPSVDPESDGSWS